MNERENPMEKKDRLFEKERRSEEDCRVSYFPVYTPREDPFLNSYYKPTAGALLILKESI